MRGEYRFAFPALLLPRVLSRTLLLLARWLYPRPEDIEAEVPNVKRRDRLVFWVYLASAGLVAFGFADFPRIA